MTRFQRQATLLIAALVLGCLALFGGIYLFTWRSGQVDAYNSGIEAYRHDDLPKAIRYFGRSIEIYQDEAHAPWIHRFIYPRPSKELAAMAYFQQAKAYVQNNQAELAVEAFKESLRLNPGGLLVPKIEDLRAEDAERMSEEAMVVRYDLEMLFKARPDLAARQGKGAKGRGNGKRQQAPGQQPSDQPGKGKPDDI